MSLSERMMHGLHGHAVLVLVTALIDWEMQRGIKSLIGMDRILIEVFIGLFQLSPSIFCL
jgi:hypothetical protein